MPTIVARYSQAGRTRKKKVRWGGLYTDVVSEIEYRPAALRVGEDVAHVDTDDSEYEASADDSRSITKQLAAAIVTWDLEGPVPAEVVADDGAIRVVEVIPAGPFPPTEEMIDRLDYGMRVAIFQGLLNAEADNPLSRKTRRR